MADELYLSYRLRGFTEPTMVRHFETMLKAFPFSRLSQSGVTVRVNAVSFNEPPLYEQAFENAADLAPIMGIVREYHAADCATMLDGYWDLWQFDGDWRLSPTRTSLMLFGPEFETELGDQLRINLGIDSLFVPQAEIDKSAFMAQSNVRSLLHLIHELDEKLPVETRRLWTESGENFADRLGAALRDRMPGPRLVK